MHPSKCFYVRLCTIGYFVCLPFFISSEFTPEAEFNSHRLFYPKVYHAKESRPVSSSKIKQDDSKHMEEITIYIDADDKRYTLDLRLNSGLISKTYFEKHQTDGGDHDVNRPQDVELCYYNGNIRGIDNSWAAISTCDGVSGVVYDGKSMHYIDSVPSKNVNGSVNGMHVIYSQNDLNSNNNTCGFEDSINYEDPDRMVTRRNKRSIRDRNGRNILRGPYNSDKTSRYIELVLVIDRMLYKHFNENAELVRRRCKEIVNIINSLYMPLNIYVALVGVVIWTNFDEITVENDGDKTLSNFLHYRREQLVEKYPNDNAQLLTRVQFNQGVVGKALKGSICTYQYSGGVNMYHSNTVGLVATTVAHEMGHNLGMEHDTLECKCPGDRCIMSPSASSSTPTDWSTCSQEFLTFSFEHGMDYCLRNRPESLFDGPVCGNSFVEAGEQCDCGLPELCNNPCCDAATCMLHSNATCAIGKCCDTNTCKLRPVGTECRSANNECDLPEYCSGYSEYCAADVYKIDGEPCNSGEAYCYEGNCRTHSDQCQLLWGNSGYSSDTRCYELNVKGNRHGNCGYNRLNQTYAKCDSENIYCGMLQCKHISEKLEYGMETVSILSQTFITSNNNIIPCRTAIVDFGLNDIDPGLAPDGSKCADNKMCLNQKCVPVEDVRAAIYPEARPADCHKNGVCNSKGHCHCKVGFAPPFCEFSGPGGSEDSGPASHPNDQAGNGIMKHVYMVLLGLFMLATVIVLYTYYRRRSPSHFWISSCHPAYVLESSSNFTAWCCNVFNYFACCSTDCKKHNNNNNSDAPYNNKTNRSRPGIGGVGRMFSSVNFRSFSSVKLNCLCAFCSFTSLRKTNVRNPRHHHPVNNFDNTRNNQKRPFARPPSPPASTTSKYNINQRHLGYDDPTVRSSEPDVIYDAPFHEEDEENHIYDTVDVHGYNPKPDVKCYSPSRPNWNVNRENITTKAEIHRPAIIDDPSPSLIKINSKPLVRTSFPYNDDKIINLNHDINSRINDGGKSVSPINKVSNILSQFDSGKTNSFAATSIIINNKARHGVSSSNFDKKMIIPDKNVIMARRNAISSKQHNSPPNTFITVHNNTKKPPAVIIDDANNRPTNIKNTGDKPENVGVKSKIKTFEKTQANDNVINSSKRNNNNSQQPTSMRPPTSSAVEKRMKFKLNKMPEHIGEDPV